jgi:uncharacterized membrane protein YgdD (TMEM256/DUF423 family)
LGEKTKPEPDEETWEVRKAAAARAVKAAGDAEEEEIITEAVRHTATDAAKKAAAAEALRSASDDLKKEIATEAVQTLSAEAKRDVASVLGAAASDSINRLAQAEPGDILQVAASQIALLASYYKAVLDQAKMSFRWALVAAGIGLVFFLGSVFFLLTRGSEAVATVGVISGALVEVIAGINFYLYNRTTAQLADFHYRLEQTQRYLLANSICEALQGDKKQETRASLIQTIANPAIQRAKPS